MNIKCPNCNTIFDFKGQTLQNSIKFKCIVCSHIWDQKIENKKKSPILKETGSSYKKIIILNFFLVLLFIAILVVFKEDLKYSDDFWRSFYYKLEELVPIK